MVRLRNLFSGSEITLPAIERANRWLCHPAIITFPATVGGKIRESRLSDISAPLVSTLATSPHSSHTYSPTLVAHVQPVFDALAAVVPTTDRTRYVSCLDLY